MNIVFLTQYCPPEVGAPQNRIFEMAKLLKKKGHEVSILTAFPNYPRGEIFPEYQGQKSMVEELEGIKIIRTWISPAKEKSFIKRLIEYFSFTISSVVQGKKLVGNPDVIITESPPLFLGWSGYKLCKKTGAKFVFNISDLWPESAVKLGALNNKLFIKMSTWLEEFCYKKSNMILGQTQGIIENIIDRGFNEEKIHLITNGVDTSLFSKKFYDEKFREEIGVGEKFFVGYAGTHGLAQGLDSVIEAARLIKDNDDIRIVLIGDGAEKKKLMEMVEEYKLDNVIFVPIQPKKHMPKIVASMDVTLIPLKKKDIFKGALPSKMFEALVSEIPVILGVEGEAERLINNAHAGIPVEPENSEEMAAAILKLYNDRALLKSMGKNGKKYVDEHYNRIKIADKLEKLLIEVCK
ncbi:glycosyltransferase family 4 protein [Oceanirhabdus seepicola]|uniref:Glycosyltransferase family 4 protein n=1 Tax=Oceanirhabdus seepicola TaxID=2828781 RepID=A0A9J6P6W8_9CLOT|nr:glycosyltransferase family 4 protein [Oceanirhabdus seepicola]MCM1992503.1 glycosyltransferase family 4 protein [Oceanirhabdus seepicola]